MIRLIEAKNYRCLNYVRQTLGHFHVLIGPNASGKTTFLDVINFVSDIVHSGIDAAITNRSAIYNDLTFAGQGGDIELALEAEIPSAIREKIWNPSCDRIRYEVAIGLTPDTQEHAIKDERVIIYDSQVNEYSQEPPSLFPQQEIAPNSLLHKRYQPKTYRQVLRKNPKGNDNYNDETYQEGGKGWLPSFKLGIKRSALGNMPADESRFPAAAWLQNLLLEGVQLFILDSLNIRKASPPGQSRRFKTDGSNLPWVIEELRKNERRFHAWIEHLKTALPDIENIDTIERPEDKHRYLRIHYQGGIIVPSWLVSDGTLRLLALTLPAYLPDFSGVYLIEEPENGIHPKAIETVYQSLSSVYNAQILMASHSPVILSMVEPQDLLCFAKTPEGITDIVLGSEHPNLREWHGEVNLSTLYASGLLG